ncbi:MAG: peptidyl-prolyl cis-trans isomerase [Planctomycetes bacterium]|nr:peptidyl-prolyl cis-trans isomerase [Planctomycetota bacterium]
MPRTTGKLPADTELWWRAIGWRSPSGGRVLAATAAAALAATLTLVAPIHGGQVDDAPGRVDDPVVGTIAGYRIHASELLGKDRPATHESALGRLRMIAINRVAVADAERALTDEQRAKLKTWTRTRRAEIVAELGEGDPAKADRVLRQRGEGGLDAYVRDLRERSLTSRRLRQVVDDRIVIVPDEVRREYRLRADEFRPPTTRSVRLIRAIDTAAADRIDRALADGVPFAEVAESPDNAQRRRTPMQVIDGGLAEPLASAVVTLEAGQHSPRVEYRGGFAWVAVERIDAPAPVTLADATPAIEKDLRRRKGTELQRAYFEKLFTEAGHTAPFRDLEAMVRAALATQRPRGN